MCALAEIKRKKPRHTKLVLPGSGAAKDRLGRSTAGQRPAEAPAAGTDDGALANPPANADAPRLAGGQDAARSRKKRPSPAKRKKRMRRMRLLVVVLVLAVAALVYTTGVYLTVFTLFSDLYDSARFALAPGKGYPADYTLSGYIKAEAMGDAGAALLGERDLSILTSTGIERRVQHGFPNPGLSAGNTRVVVYQRGGREFVVEGRSKTLGRRTLEQDIQFAEMSPAGWLAMATASRYQATLTVYSPGYDIGDPLLELNLVDEKPVLASFCGDNRSLLLGCYTVENGTLSSSIHLLRTDRDAIQATIAAPGAQLLRAEYLNKNRVLALYDSFAALYDATGQELARLDYGGRSLATSDYDDGHLLLVFASGTQEGYQALLADKDLKTLAEVSATSGSASPKALATANGFYLLVEQEVLAYDTGGKLADTLLLEARAMGLLRNGGPLLLTGGQLIPLDGMLNPQAAQSAASGTQSSLSGTA